jgi:hypothetical protein
MYIRPRAVTRGLAAVVTLAFAAPTGAAAPAHLWSTSFGTSGVSSRGFGVAADAAGVVLTGSFNGTVNFGGSDLSAQGTDVVLAKYNGAGAHQWSKRLGGSAADQGYAVALDGAGNVLVTGYFQGTTANFGGGNLFNSGSSDVFVAKYDASGNHVWSRSVGTADSDVGYAIATDGAGNVVVVGYVHGSLPSDILIVKYNAAGTILWMNVPGSAAGYDEALSVATDAAGNVLVTGSFSGTVDFGGGNLSTPGDDWDVFVVKYGPNGAHVWSRRFGDTDLEAGTAIKTDAANRVILAGYFMGSVDFGGGPLVSTGADVDLFLARYSPGGAHLWSRRLGGASYENASALAVDEASNIFLTGYFDDMASFGGGDLVSNGGADIFFAEYDSSGAYASSQRFGGTATDAAQAIAVDASGNRYLTGYFTGQVDFGGGVITSNGTPDVFLAKFGSIVSGAGSGPAFESLAMRAVPNPFNPATTLHYRIPAPGRVTIDVYDVRGRVVATLRDGDEAAGSHSVRWDGRDREGHAAASGVYFARIAHGGAARTQKLVLLK